MSPSSPQTLHAQVDELRELFRLVDKDGGGSVDESELMILLQTINVTVPKVRHCNACTPARRV